MPKLPNSIADVAANQPPMEEGTYRAEITDAELGKSKKSGVPMVTVNYKITEGQYEGRQVSDYCTLQTKEGKPNEPGLRSLKRIAIAAVGEDRASSEDFDTDELQGQAVLLVLKQEGYQDEAGDDQISNKVKKVLPAK